VGIVETHSGPSRDWTPRDVRRWSLPLPLRWDGKGRLLAESDSEGCHLPSVFFFPRRDHSGRIGPRRARLKADFRSPSLPPFFLPAAVGAKLGQPDRRWSLVLGEGDFLMTAHWWCSSCRTTRLTSDPRWPAPSRPLLLSFLQPDFGRLGKSFRHRVWKVPRRGIDGAGASPFSLFLLPPSTPPGRGCRVVGIPSPA